jgi:cytochrome P450
MDPATRVFADYTCGSKLLEKSILHKVLGSDIDSEKSLAGMQDEIVGNILAGTEAVANTLLTISFHLIRSPKDCDKLRLELREQNTGENMCIEKMPVLVSTSSPVEAKYLSLRSAPLLRRDLGTMLHQ